MGIPADVIMGTVAFVIFGCVLNLGMYTFIKSKYKNERRSALAQRKYDVEMREQRRLACLLPPMAVFLMWLTWVCCWLHQWHPLVRPIKLKEGG